MSYYLHSRRRSPIDAVAWAPRSAATTDPAPSAGSMPEMSPEEARATAPARMPLPMAMFSWSRPGRDKGDELRMPWRRRQRGRERAEREGDKLDTDADTERR